MKNMIGDLWNGLLCPIDSCGVNDPETENLVRLLEIHQSKLDKILTESQKKTLANTRNAWRNTSAASRSMRSVTASAPAVKFCVKR